MDSLCDDCSFERVDSEERHGKSAGTKRSNTALNMFRALSVSGLKTHIDRRTVRLTQYFLWNRLPKSITGLTGMVL